MKNPTKSSEFLFELVTRLRRYFNEDSEIDFTTNRENNTIIILKKEERYAIGFVEVNKRSTTVFVFPEYREAYLKNISFALIKNGLTVYGKETRKRLNENRERVSVQPDTNDTGIRK